MKLYVTENCWDDADALDCKRALEDFISTAEENDLLKCFEQVPGPILKKRLDQKLRIIAYNIGDVIILARIVDRASNAYQDILDDPTTLPFGSGDLPETVFEDSIGDVRTPLFALEKPIYGLETDETGRIISTVEKRIHNIALDVSEVSERLAELCQRARKYHQSEPETALNQARKAAELICKDLYLSSEPVTNAKLLVKLDLNHLIQTLNHNEVLSRANYLHLCTIRDYGNYGSHDQGEESMEITPDFVKPCLEALACVAKWYATAFASKRLSEAELKLIRFRQAGFSLDP